MYKEYLQPVSNELQEFANSCNSFCLGASVQFKESIVFDGLEPSSMKIALLGVMDGRVEAEEVEEDVDFSLIRTELYTLYLGNWHFPMYDFGNVDSRSSKEETARVFHKVVSGLLQDGYRVVILGGSPSFAYQQYRAYDELYKNVQFISVDNRLRLGDEDAPCSEDNYLTKIILQEPLNLLDYTTIGYQTYFVAQEQLDLLEQLNFEAVRLGVINQSIQEIEPLTREANAMVINLEAMQKSDFSSTKTLGPNGFSAREICGITKYAGFSHELSSLYISNYFEKYQKADHLLVAEMIWYFIDGLNNRPEIKKIDDTQYFDKIFVPSKDNDYVFYRQKFTEQWWIEISILSNDGSTHQTYVPCSKSNYEQALNGEIPNKWWRYFKKFY